MFVHFTLKVLTLLCAVSMLHWGQKYLWGCLRKGLPRSCTHLLALSTIANARRPHLCPYVPLLPCEPYAAHIRGQVWIGERTEKEVWEILRKKINVIIYRSVLI